MSTPPDVTESGVTIKAGKGYENMWLTPKGSPEEIKLWLMGMFALPEDAVAGASPFEVVKMAEEIVQGVSAVATKLGGTVVSEATRPTTEGNAWSETGSQGGSGGFSKDEPKGPDFGWIIEAIGAATDLVALKRLWVENKDGGAFADQSVKDAYNAKSKALKDAA